MIEGKARQGNLDGTLAPSVFRVPERCPSADTAKAQQRRRLGTQQRHRLHTQQRHRWQGYGSIKCLRDCAGTRQEGWLAGRQRVGQRRLIGSVRLEGCCMLAVVGCTIHSTSSASSVNKCQLRPCDARCAMRRAIPGRPALSKGRLLGHQGTHGAACENSNAIHHQPHPTPYLERAACPNTPCHLAHTSSVRPACTQASMTSLHATRRC